MTGKSVQIRRIFQTNIRARTKSLPSAGPALPSMLSVSPTCHSVSTRNTPEIPRTSDWKIPVNHLIATPLGLRQPAAAFRLASLLAEGTPPDAAAGCGHQSGSRLPAVQGPFSARNRTRIQKVMPLHPPSLEARQSVPEIHWPFVQVRGFRDFFPSRRVGAKGDWVIPATKPTNSWSPFSFAGETLGS